MGFSEFFGLSSPEIRQIDAETSAKLKGFYDLVRQGNLFRDEIIKIEVFLKKNPGRVDINYSPERKKELEDWINKNFREGIFGLCAELLPQLRKKKSLLSERSSSTSAVEKDIAEMEKQGRPILEDVEFELQKKRSEFDAGGQRISDWINKSNRSSIFESTIPQGEQNKYIILQKQIDELKAKRDKLKSVLF